MSRRKNVLIPRATWPMLAALGWERSKQLLSGACLGRRGVSREAGRVPRGGACSRRRGVSQEGGAWPTGRSLSPPEGVSHIPPSHLGSQRLTAAFCVT